MFSGNAAAEPEGRPARAERAAADGDKFAAAEQRAGIISALHIAIVDVNIFATYEMETVIVPRDAAVDMDAFHFYIGALDHAHDMIRAADQIDVAHDQVLAAIKQQCVGSVVAI